MKLFSSKSINNQRGASNVEYSFLISLIAIVALTSIQDLGVNVSGSLNSAAAAMSYESAVAGSGGQPAGSPNAWGGGTATSNGDDVGGSNGDPTTQNEGFNPDGEGESQNETGEGV